MARSARRAPTVLHNKKEPAQQARSFPDASGFRLLTPFWIFFHFPVSIIQGSKVQMVSFRFTNRFTSSEKQSSGSCRLALGY